jgi:ABC-type branched-subunit amino acid transport system ATPase component/ABC-type branched-subunit amino acid transport system permease subunit
MTTSTLGLKKGIFQTRHFPILIFCLGSLVLSWYLGPVRYTQRIIILILLWAAASSGFNIISGYGGQTVFGYMMFVGTGAYTSVILFKFLAVSPWIGIWIGAIIACIIAVIIGFPTLRLRGAFFAMATMAFPLITFALICNLGCEELTIPFTGHGPISMQFTDTRYYVLIALLLLCAILLYVSNMENSRFGYALKALKENETAAEGLGIDTFRIKMLAFVVSAAVGGLVGTIYAFSVLFVLTAHAVFGLSIIVRILAIASVGGLGTLWGPVVASAILVPAGEYLNSQFGNELPGLQDIIYGLALIFAILFMPEGIWGKVAKMTRRKNPLPDPTGDPNRYRIESFRPFENRTYVSEKSGAKKESEPILRLEGVSKSFGGVKALSDLSIEIPAGKIIGVIGPNGSGKTTLFNVIHGYLKPEGGKVFFEGEETTHLRPHELCARGIGRTFQVPQIFRNFTVHENIMMGTFAKQKDVGRVREISEEAAFSVGLTKKLYDRAIGLSILETKKVEFARALATFPRLILVDEPMAGLNHDETLGIGKLMESIAKQGITILVIEHVVDSLIRIADLMVGMDRGQKIAVGTPAEVTSDPYMIEAYLGAKWRSRYAKT